MFPINFLYCWIRSFHGFHAFLPGCTLQHLLNFISIIGLAAVSFYHTWRLGHASIRTQSWVCEEVGTVGVCL